MWWKIAQLGINVNNNKQNTEIKKTTSRLLESKTIKYHQISYYFLPFVIKKATLYSMGRNKISVPLIEFLKSMFFLTTKRHYALTR